MDNLIISNKDTADFEEVALTLAVVEGQTIHATSVEESMIELKELVQSAGSEVKAELILHQKIDENYYLDRPTLDELTVQADELGINIIVVIDELSGTQMKNMELVTGKKIVDRTILLLDIFSSRANRRESKLQIEKAQLKYRLSKLEAFQNKYKYSDGIGVNSPNGKRLLTDENKINRKLSALDIEISIVVKNRFVQRTKKSSSDIPLVAFIGYTNSGKSTLINKLIEKDPYHSKESEILVAHKMLSTQDVSLRKSRLMNGKYFLLVDTVGFVSDIPRTVRTAFRSTFEEVANADLIVTVYDASSNGLDAQKSIMEYTLKRIGVEDKKNISIYNKADKLDEIPEGDNDTLYLSAKTEMNFNEFLEMLQDNLYPYDMYTKLLIPYSRYDVFNEIKETESLKMDDFALTEVGIELNISLSPENYDKYKIFIK
ncbi:GTPase HflX [Peptostreptococcus faecalis]|uniref:GTPase HflX n=1 Tax=Peptostreptococcus faecalis TaxID=2045015 RepID=UPI000C7A727D|nr:GTPase HflX [Peptostreptococcus faecalis]